MLYRLTLAALVASAGAFNAPMTQVRSSQMRVAATPCMSVAAGDVEDKVKAIIAEQLGVEAGEVTPSSSFTEDLGTRRGRRSPLSQPAIERRRVLGCTRPYSL